MRRPLALVAVLALAAPAAKAAEPLDMDLALLGSPSAAVWMNAGLGLTQAQADALAADARARFALLGSELALALSSALLQPAATVGHSGFAFDLETAYAQVHRNVVGTAAFATDYPRDFWPTRTKTPSALLIPSFHVRKALPFSVELGGRVLYLSQSSYFAAQLHGKWAIQEGYAMIPDVAVMAAYTMFLGPKNLNLSSTDLMLLVSKRFGVNATMSLTPYLAPRLLLVRASSDALGYEPGGATPVEFPTLDRSLYRTTLGVRMTAYATSLAAEATYFGGASAKAGPYPAYSVKSSLSGAIKLGFEY